MIAFACCSVVSLFLVAVLTLRAKTSGAAMPRAGIDIFQLAARYRPMLRLLEGSDFELLSEAGDPKLMRKIRSQRRIIFRAYLRGLRRDHSMLCDQIRRVMVSADSDRKDLASALFRTEMAFTFLMTVIEFRLVLHAFGFGSVAAAALVDSFERVSQHAKLVSAPHLANLAA